MNTPSRLLTRAAACSAFITGACVGNAALASDPELPRFDFSDEFYLANGIQPDLIIGRPDGSGPNSVIDNTDNGPDYNNVRILQHAAAYDGEGKPIFFYVTGLLQEHMFTDNEAGQEAREIADEYVVYEFPSADAPVGSVFPKRQDLIADLSGGYFSNDPLGIWQINIIKYTPEAFSTPGGQAMLSELAAKNGLDLDGTPIIRTKLEVQSLLADGFASNFIPPADGSAGLRWFFCPVIEDPRNGAIMPDAHLEVTGGIAAADEFIEHFECLQTAGDWCNNCPEDINDDEIVGITDLLVVLATWGDTGVPGEVDADTTLDGVVDIADLLACRGRTQPRRMTDRPRSRKRGGLSVSRSQSSMGGGQRLKCGICAGCI